jgi:hypothetical protein
MIAGILLSLFLAAPASASAAAAEAEPPFTSMFGSGLFTLPDTRTLPPRRFTVSTTLHNRDRDPLGLDVFDYGLAVAVGITPRMEVYGQGVFSRVVVVPDVSQTSPALPPPPLDVVMPNDMVLPARPHYELYAPMPYANGRGDQRFSDLVPGDLVLGVKRRMWSPVGGAPRFAASAELKIPLTRRLGALQSGSGTGSLDATVRLTAEKRLPVVDVVMSGGFTYVSRPVLADRVVRATPVEAAVKIEPLDLPHRIDLGLGLRHSFNRSLAAIAEAVAVMEVGGTRTLDAAPPLDMLVGLQARVARVRVTGGLLYHGRALDSRVRPSPLRGFVDLSRSSPEDAQAYLEQGGLGGAVSVLRPGVQLVTPRLRGGVPLPTGARIIPDTYKILSEHQIGFVFVLGWAF